ncbi:hypothetical protein pqer_cds_1127 [Pandoravirus quercus]|uniref:Uncharacterized protein n=1 Tax=Pandoravirus quercus TaxID=2107709 RepID=A0A2U7UAT5_9VIRU|nr:hypothetical protein pqer_cds_1127 [Pandoravirus quercus]AVK75549.1 hypothetical protein pqer_cds_1127 [Pandoravirus quercus]
METAQTVASDEGDSGTHKGQPAVHIVACADSNDTIAVDDALPGAFCAAGQRDAIEALVKDAPIVSGARSASVSKGECDDSLSARWPTPWSGPRRPPRGCMVALLGRCNVALAASAIAWLDRDDLLSLWHASPRTRTVLVDVLTTGPTSPCHALVHVDETSCPAERATAATVMHICPQDEPAWKRTGAAWLWLDVLPRLQSKCGLVEQMLARPSAFASGTLKDYVPGALERTILWAAATRCGAVVIVCLTLGDRLSDASTAYSRSGGFVKRAASASRVSAWLAGAMGAEDGKAADLATTDTWLSAMGLAAAAGRLGSDLLLTLAFQIAATNVATGRRFAERGQRIPEPTDPGKRASLARVRLILTLVCSLDQARHPTDPPRSADSQDGDDDARAARLLDRVRVDGLVDNVLRSHALRSQPLVGSALGEMCRRLRDIAVHGSSLKGCAAGALLAHVFVITSPIDHADGWHHRSWTMRTWTAVAPALAVAGTNPFWAGLHTQHGPTSALHESLAETADGVPLVNGASAMAGVDHTSASLHGSVVPITVGDRNHRDNKTTTTAALAEDDVDYHETTTRDGGLTLLGLFEHEIDLCVEVAARLPPWDLISLATVSRGALKSVWAAVCRASLDTSDNRLAGVTCGASVYIGSGSSVPLMPAPDADFAHALGALMLTCHRMPRMEMMADDVKALASLTLGADDASERLDALERDPNLPAMLADTVAYAARLGCGAVLVRCLEVAGRMEDVVRHNGRDLVADHRLGLWLNRQMCANRCAPTMTGIGGAWLPVAALAYAAGRERSLVLLSIACNRIHAMRPATTITTTVGTTTIITTTTATTTTIATTFWGPAGRRVCLGDSDTQSATSYAERLAVVIAACLAGLEDRRFCIEKERMVDMEAKRDADEVFLHGMEPTVDFLIPRNWDALGAATSVIDIEADETLQEALRQMGAAEQTGRGARAATLCLTARFLVAPPGQPLPADSMRAYIANLLVRAASCNHH